jgi:glycosyltransferase involved in cell wall biosynthesis
MGVSAVLCLGPETFDRLGRVVRHLAVGLVDHAVHLRILSWDRRVESLALGPIQTVLHAPAGRMLFHRRLRHVAETLSVHPPSVVHALSGEAYALSRALAEMYDADLVWQLASLANQDAVRTKRPECLMQVVTWSRRLAEGLAGAPGLDPHRVSCVPPGILAAARPAYSGRTDRATTILCAVPLDYGGGIDQLIEVFSMLRNRGREFMAFLLGEGPRESSLRRRVGQLGLASRVIFAHPAGDWTQALNSADVFVHPQVDVSYSAEVLSAMGAGLAVVMYPSPIYDHLQEDQTAAVCREPTVECLADALDRVLTNPEYGRRIAGGGLEYVRSNHTVSAMADGMAAIYRRLVLARTTFPLHT